MPFDIPDSLSSHRHAFAAFRRVARGFVAAAFVACTLGSQLDGRTYVWGGAESRAMTAVRRHVRHERGLAREQVSLVAYWRHRDHPPEPESED